MFSTFNLLATFTLFPEGTKKPFCHDGVANLWFYYPFRRIPRKDHFEWAEDVPALIIAVPCTINNEKPLINSSSSDINCSSTDIVLNQNTAPTKPPRRRPLHFGGREFKVACNGTTGVILNHGCDVTKG